MKLKLIAALACVSIVFTSGTAGAAAAEKSPKPDAKIIVCLRLEEVINKQNAKMNTQQQVIKSLEKQYDKVCPPQAKVTISENGCVVTAQGPKGAVITYGAYSPDRGRGFDAEPVTIINLDEAFTGYTGAGIGLIAYVTVTNKGKQLATKAAPVTAPICLEGQPANGGYPWADAPFPSTSPDPWGMYKRESVSYAAFRVDDSGRFMPYWGGRGNAKQWPSNARAMGFAVDNKPQVGDVAISTDGTYGHAMYVEAIVNDRVFVSQFNASGDGNYSLASRSIAGLTFIHF